MSRRTIHGRILHVISSLDGGGAERVLLTVLAGLPDWEHHVTIANGGAMLSLVPEHVTVQDAGTEDALLSLMANLQPDVVHTWHGGSLLAASLPAAYLGIPLVHRLYNVPSAKEPFEPSVRADRRRMSWALGAASAVVALSSACADDASKYYGIARPRVITNGFPLAGNRSSQPMHAAKSPSRQVLLAIGRLVPEKGHAVLIEALRRIAVEHSNCELWVAGVGRLEGELRSQAAEAGLSERVKFLGFQEDVASLHAQADLFVCPSITEGFGNAVAEAMIAGLPVVASDLPAIRYDILNNSPSARLVPPGDAAELACVLSELLSDSAARRQLSRDASSISGRLSVSAMLNGYRELYQTLAEPHHAIA